MRILLYLSIICMGAWFGYSEILSEKILNKISKVQYFCLLLLLSIMGISIGINREVVRIFYKLGYQALILSIFSIIFSILGIRMVSKYLSRDDREVNENVN